MNGADEDRWLDENEQAAWTALVSVLLTLPGALDAQLQADAGMTLYRNRRQCSGLQAGGEADRPA
jgi:hypothetical protein